MWGLEHSCQLLHQMEQWAFLRRQSGAMVTVNIHFILLAHIVLEHIPALDATGAVGVAALPENNGKNCKISCTLLLGP
jgi:hypothetical protein